METDKQYFNRMDDEAAMEDAIESKATEIQETLLSDEKFTNHKGVKFDLVDFFADFEVENDTLSEFLSESQIYGTGQYLRKKMTEALDVFCADLAKDEIDNQEPNCEH